MKHFILAVIAVGVLFFSCSEDYLVDGGISDPNVNMKTLEFLKSHYQLDTLAILIERAGLADDVNGETTLFAPNNVSIGRFVTAVLTEMRKIDPQAQFSINDIPTDTLEKYMGSYIFQGKITRDDMTREGQIYTALNGEQRRISLEPVYDYGSNLSDPPEYVYLTYKGGEEWDEWNSVKDDRKIVIRTSNLISTNGVIHVLQGSHILFNYDPDI